MMNVFPKIQATLDPTLVPAALWNRSFREQARASGGPVPVLIALQRPDGTCSTYATTLLPLTGENAAANLYCLERTLKFLLWQRGASKVFISGCDEVTNHLSSIYSEQGARKFDHQFFGEKVYGESLQIMACREEEMPESKELSSSLGGHLSGCRIGFDLGGSDRKCAAVMDGKVVFSEEIPWDPYFETDPQYHIDGINDSLKRAAEHLPQVDAIGGSAAGIYVNNEVRAASLFRGISPEDFEKRIRHLFLDLKKEWNNIPFEVVNDGEVTALAGSMSLNSGALLGVSMGTSEAAGYCDKNGRITNWLNELAFAPVDYRDHAPTDEWSGDIGCGVQTFSQQGVARLAGAAGFTFADDEPLAERLVHIQNQMKTNDPAARGIFEAIGTSFGYSLAHYADFYELQHVLILGRVTSGDGGQLIIDGAREVLKHEFPELDEQLSISMPDEAMKRHGQAVAAASLPQLENR